MTCPAYCCDCLGTGLHLGSVKPLTFALCIRCHGGKINRTVFGPAEIKTNAKDAKP